MTPALIFITCLAGWYIANIIGTGDGFAAIHGRYDGVRKYNIFNRWIYWGADKVYFSDWIWDFLPNSYAKEAQFSAEKRRRLWGFWFMTLRGLYKAPMIIALAFIVGKPLASLWALLCLLDGACYWLGGFPREHRYSVAVAEILSGALLGVMAWGVIG